MTMTSPHRVQAQLEAELRVAILRHLHQRRLDRPDRLAKALDILPMKAEEILERDRWTLQACVWMIDELHLPLVLHVQEAA